MVTFKHEMFYFTTVSFLYNFSFTLRTNMTHRIPIKFG